MAKVRKKTSFLEGLFSKKRSASAAKIEQDLVYAVALMNVMSATGVSPDRFFRAIATENFGISKDAAQIVRDLDIFGLDIISALKRAQQRSSSRVYAELLDGYISTVHSGGDLNSFLRNKTQELMFQQKESLKEFLNRLGILAEGVISATVVLPLLILIVFSVSALLPGGALSDPRVIFLLVYGMLPIFSIGLLLVIKASTPGI